MKKRKKEDFIENGTDKVTGIEDAENRDSAETEAEKKDAETEVLQGKNLEEELNDQKDKYLRLYAEFENYKKEWPKIRRNSYGMAMNHCFMSFCLYLTILKWP